MTQGTNRRRPAPHPECRALDERGFSLIELLVVVLIIGILAAVALPAFLGQRARGQDAGAKSHARSMVAHVESCFATTEDYRACTTDAGSRLDTGGIPETAVSSTASDSYRIVSTSASLNSFAIDRDSSGYARSCDTSNGTTIGGCNGSSW